MSHPALAGSPLTFRLHSGPTYWRCEPEWFWLSRPLPDYLLWCVLDGSGWVRLDDRTSDAGPGRVREAAEGCRRAAKR